MEQAQQVLAGRQAAREAKEKPGELRINVQEPEAVIQPQKDKKRFAASYKPSVLANEIRVIVGVGLDASSETGVVAGMLEQAQGFGSVERALFDAGYFSEEGIRVTQQRGIDLLCPEGQSQGECWNKESDKQYPKSRFEDDPVQDCYRCPAGAVQRPGDRYPGNENAAPYVRYQTEACEGCAQRSACTRAKGGRKIKRYPIDDAKDALRRRLQSPAVRAEYRQRQAMGEAVFSQLRHRQPLQRFRRRGLAAVRLEFTLHAMAYNLGRAVARGGAWWHGVKHRLRLWWRELSAGHSETEVGRIGYRWAWRA